MLQPTMFVVNVQVALRCNDQLLVIGRSQDEAHAGGALDIPVGTVDTFELGPAVLEAVARREVLEETGVAIEAGLRYVCSASFRAQDGHPVINVSVCGHNNPRVTHNTSSFRSIVREVASVA